MIEVERQTLEEARAQLAPLTVYTVEGILGEGAIGMVLKVYHRRLCVHHAMKLVHARLLRSRIIRGRFDTEARIMHALNHKNVVKVHDLGELPDGSPYIAMDYLEGGTLEDHLNVFGAMPPKQALQVAVAILRGLQAAHDKGIVHRDIKPLNILFDRDGTPKITDFGIARLEEGTRSLTREGAKMGSPGYVSPEQWYGQVQLVDVRADVYSVGVTLYVMLTAQGPGEGLFCDQLKAFPQCLDGLPELLQRVVRKSVDKEREDRFPTAAAMVDELEILVTGFHDDPADTPALGSAPAVKARADSAAEVTDPRILRIGGTLAPSPTQALPGDKEAARSSSEIIVFEDPSESASTGIIHPDVDDDTEAAEFAKIRQMARRRFYRRVVLLAVGFLFVLMVGMGVWFTRRPTSIVEAEPMAQPVVVAPPVEAETLPTLVATSIAEHTPEPIKTPSVKPNHTPKVVVKPPLEAAVTVEEKAQVRLILKPDTTATVTLSGDGGTFVLTDGSLEVPQGTYRVSVDMPGREAPQTGTLTVTRGVTTVECDSRFKKCKGLK